MGRYTTLLTAVKTMAARTHTACADLSTWMNEAPGATVYFTDATQSLATRHQRQHQRSVAGASAEGKRLEWPHPERAGCAYQRTEQPTTQVVGLQVSS